MSRDVDAVRVMAFSFIVGIALIGQGFSSFRRRRRVEDLPTSPIRSAAQGLVEFQGYAYPLAKQVETGIRGGRIVYSEVSLLKNTKSGNSSNWEVQYEGTFGSRFVLRDATGAAHVIVKGAELEIDTNTYDWDDLNPQIQNSILTNVLPRMKKISSFFTHTPGDGNWRVSEKNIYIGKSVYVAGAFRSRSNEPEVELIDEKNTLQKVTPTGGVMNDSVHPLIIADCHQEEFLRRLGNWNLVKMVSGAVLIAVAVWLLVDL